MARGILSGMIWGSVVSVLGLAAVSVATDPPMLNPATDPATSSPARVPEAASDPAPSPEVATQRPAAGTDDAPAPAVVDGDPPEQPAMPDVEVESLRPPPEPSDNPDAPQMAAGPEGESAPEIGGAADPAPAPVPSTEAPGQPDPGATVEGSGVDVTGERPVATTETAALGDAPAAESGPVVTTETAAPPAPAEAAPEPEAEEAEPTREPDPVKPEPVEPDPVEADPEPVTPEPVEPEASDPEPEPAAPASTETETAEDDTSTPRVGRGASDLSELAPEVRTGRLPSVSGGADAPTEAAAEMPEADAETPRPVEQFAVATEVAEDAPRLAIVLIDDGSGSFGSEALSAFPYPLSFAVNATAPNAADRAADYRARGFEVLAMGDLPEGATPQDAEVALAAILQAVPEAIGVMETPDLGLQRDRQAAEQVAEVLAESGHGLVLFPKGLGTAAALAQKAGVPVASVFRDLDGEGQSPGQIRRQIEQAALRASQDGKVLLTARLRPDTISALLLWGLQDRSGPLVLVPASYVLSAE